MNQTKSQLSLVEGALEAAQIQLGEIQQQIKQSQRELDQQVGSFSRELSAARHEAQEIHNQKIAVLEAEINDRIQEKLDLIKETGNLKLQVTNLQNDHNQMVQESAGAIAQAQTQLKVLQDAVTHIDGLLRTKSQELEHVTGILSDNMGKLTRIKEKVSETEKVYIERIESLQHTQRELENAVQKATNTLGAYELSMKEVRAGDAAREKDLESRERTLTAQTRALNEERIEFAASKRRFQQTKQLQ